MVGNCTDDQYKTLFFIAGAEGRQSIRSRGEYGTGGSSAETYNPLTNTWTAAPAPGAFVSDANSEILEDGRVLQAIVQGTLLQQNKIYNPSSNTYINGPSCIGYHNESSWVKLPDNSILFRQKCCNL